MELRKPVVFTFNLHSTLCHELCVSYWLSLFCLALKAFHHTSEVLLVALFSFYLAFTGYRVLYRKTARQHAGNADWLAVTVMLAGSITLIAYGIYLTLTSSFGTVAIVFGAIGISLAAADARAFLNQPTDKKAWWYTHMTRMLGAYIATVTAFSVVNFQFLPPVARWLWATVVGTLGIIIWTRYYKKKFNRTSVQKNASDLRSVSKPV